MLFRSKRMILVVHISPDICRWLCRSPRPSFVRGPGEPRGSGSGNERTSVLLITASLIRAQEWEILAPTTSTRNCGSNINNSFIWSTINFVLLSVLVTKLAPLQVDLVAECAAPLAFAPSFAPRTRRTAISKRGDGLTAIIKKYLFFALLISSKQSLVRSVEIIDNGWCMSLSY